MTTIYKYELQFPVGKGRFMAPTGGRPVSFQLQLGRYVVWMEVNEQNHDAQYEWGVYGTGHQIPPDSGEYVGTVQAAYSLVWHLYMKESKNGS